VGEPLRGCQPPNARPRCAACRLRPPRPSLRSAAAPTSFSNLYFTELQGKWTKKKWAGPPQYEDASKQLMMLPTDMALVWDKKFRKFVDLYAKDEEKFAADFAEAFGKLLALGVPFPDAPSA
jgi:cytochrome c peroxidase